MKMDDARRALVVAGASASLPGRATGAALELPEDLAEDEWRDIGRCLHQAGQSVLWWIGDWWAYGERRYGDRKALVDRDNGWEGPPFQTCQDAAWVARTFETSRRREVVPWSVHAELARVADADERYRLLAQAEREGWSQRRARFEVGRPNASIIKPSDGWNFAGLVFDKLPWNTDEDGYIPGELYANILFYWSRPGDVVVAPMAGSGMILHVHDNRERWMGPKPWSLDLRAFDLTPRGPYADEGRIAQADALEGIEGPADLIIADIPYFGQCRGRYYSKSSRNMANMDWPAYQDALARLARSCRKAQQVGSRTVIIAAAAFDDDKARRRELIMLHIVDAFRRAGYEAADIAFSTRRIQQHQDPNMARNNTLARERRLMLSDMLVVLCFEAAEGDHLLHWPATSSRRTSPGSRSPATAALGAAPTGWPAWSSSSVATSTSCACACSSPPPARPTTPAKARCGVVPSIRRWQACSCRPPTRADAPTRLV